jgi:phosphoribosylformimino-5-aminoimidazole carboxamide ribotide isomerase
MRLIPVLDTQGGVAVHARRGLRSQYRAVTSKLTSSTDPVDVARAFRDQLGLTELYLADLDAIRSAKLAHGLYREIRALGISLWLDAGLRDRVGLEDRLDSTDVLIVGLESIAGPKEVARLARTLPRERLAFSLDLRAGEPIFAEGSDWEGRQAVEIADFVAGQGFQRIILLDLAQVGTSEGTRTSTLLSACVSRHPTVDWIIGGGIGSLRQIRDAEEQGASAALIASAFHDGRIGLKEISEIRRQA